MSTQLETNTMSLQNILNTINELPEAGSGGGGSGGTVTYETCTVNLVKAGTATIIANNLIFYALENGVPQLKSLAFPLDAQLFFPSVTCIKGSHLVLGASTSANSSIEFATTGSVELVSGNIANTLGATFKINGDGTITQTK